MYVYLAVLALIGLIFAVAHVSKLDYYQIAPEGKIHIGGWLLVAGILIVVAGFRYNVGADYAQYISNYSGYLTKELNIFEDTEIFICLIARLASKICDNPQTMIFLCSLFTIGSYMFVIEEYAEIPVLSAYLFIFLGCWLGSFNAVRQYLAATFLFLGLRYVIKGSFWKWCLFVILAVLCHTTSIIMLPIYFLVRMKDEKNFYIISFAIMVVLFFSYDRIFSAIDLLRQHETYSVAERIYAQNQVSIFRILVAWVPVLLRFFPEKIEPTNMQDRVILNYSFMHAILLTAAMNSSYLGRIQIYLMPYNALAIPLLIMRQKDEGSNRNVILIVTFIAYFLYWTFEARGTYVVNYQWVL
ncbi:MAG: EpsG family protein [Lachnospiraceae bacterium]|nr:EpsG family protein [Lachnospiraceae bacterium]